MLLCLLETGSSGKIFTILILEKLNRPSSVKFGVPSSMNARSVRYMPRYGTHGGLQLLVQGQHGGSVSKSELKAREASFPLVYLLF